MSAIGTARGRPGAAASPLRLPFLIAAIAGFALLASSAFFALDRGTPAGDRARPSAPPTLAPDRVAVIVAGIPTVIDADALVPVAGPVSARIAFERGTDRRGARDLRLTLIDVAGKPIDGATIVLFGQMRYMDHGALQAIALPDGTGGYSAHLLFAMPGEYDIRLNISAAGSTGSLLLDLDLPD